jgi:gamma-glutamyltranspeptidase / glutathione hydrolase
MRIQRKLFILLHLAAFTALWAQSAQAGGLLPVHAKNGMVASVHPLASQAGVDALKAGGNAVDAAVATGFALAVVHPQAGNIGGGGFMLIRMANGTAKFLDYREKAPAAASRDMYLDAHGNVIPRASTIGYKAAGVPGSVAGLVYANKKYGKLPLRRLIEPAIRLAREGFILYYEDAQDFRDKDLALFPTSKRILQRNGRYYEQGELFKQPELARTLERIAADSDTFYKGAVAREFAAEMQKNGGLITVRDLADYEVKEREPLRGTYRGYQILSSPPPSSGGIAIVEALNILEGWPLSTLGSRSADSIHLTAEAFRRAMYDRAEFLGDPDFNRVPVAQLTDKKYAAAWRESIHPEKASVSKELERPQKFGDLDQVAHAGIREPVYESANTTHYSVVDEAGNAVSVTTTLNDTLGSRVTIEGLGFILNNEMDDFAVKQGVPNMYGLIQGPANSIAPGKRPLSAMAPTILVKDGKLFLVTGSRGGPRIITTVANIMMGMIDYGLDIQQAVSAPRFHHQWLPDRILLESYGLSPDTMKILLDRGHKIDFYREGEEIYSGDAPSIMVDPRTGERLGASDPRGNGKAVGY